MALIVLKIPKTGGSSLFVPLAGNDLIDIGDQLPYVAGECMLRGYERMILVDTVEWRTEIAEDMSTDMRRTIHAPHIEGVKMERKTDRATPILAKWALTAYVSPHPWEFYFFRGLGELSFFPERGDPIPERSLASHFMTMKLHSPLITKYSFDLGDGDGTDSMELSPAVIEWIYYVTDANQRKLGQKSIRYDVQKGVYSGAEGLF